MECSYRQPARYDEVIRIRTALPSVSARGMRFVYEILGEGGRLANGETRHVFADESGRPVRARQDVVDRLEGFRTVG